MKNAAICTLILFLSLSSFLSSAQVIDPKADVQNNATNRVNNNISTEVDKGLGTAENAIKGLFKKKKKAADTPAPVTQTTPPPAANIPPPVVQTAPVVQPSFSPYQNYDFVPGEQILFEDHFADDVNGELPAHWKLINGQAVMNKVDNKPSILITDGNYGVMAPRMKKDHYLGDTFTLEFDFIYKKATDIGYGSYSDAPGVEFYYKDPATSNEYQFRVVIGHDNVIVGELVKKFPEALANGFDDAWHHVALIYKEGQMKTYIDQYRVCVNPNLENKPYRLSFDGIGSENAPIIFTNVKIANGGGMNIIGKKFTDTKIITHGINFDIDKATIKPESMGTLNSIAQILKDNADLKFEVDGHTDNSGAAAHNLSLSQLRADAVKTQLIKMGIDASRLSTKGFGDTKPLTENLTIEGKANNRRVEFVKL